MTNISDELKRLADEFTLAANSLDTTDAKAAIETLESAVGQADSAFSGSWLGYHSCVYYSDLQRPPVGAVFSAFWGLKNNILGETTGEWTEYTYHQIYDFIKSQTTGLGLDELLTTASKVDHAISGIRENLISALSALCSKYNDEYLSEKLAEIKSLRTLGVNEFIKYHSPSGSTVSKDIVAITNGITTPPHVHLQAQVEVVKNCKYVAVSLAKHASQVEAHISRLTMIGATMSQGSRVFIGHGQSQDWRDLKDFLQDRLALDWDEFNRVPIAGITNITRLSEMLDQAGIAFVVMTAEDEQNDGSYHARMNVIHEAGLFQGKLGFSKAILILEEGCSEFSNVQGLGQIRYQRGNISGAFEEIRRILERENIIVQS